MKFTQPVSMQCSQEQFEKDLKEPLIKLGYKKFGNCNDEDFLITNFGESPYRMTFTVSVCIHDFNRHFIDHYNPQLFIALSSMSDKPNGIVGEWFRFASDCDTSLVMKRNYFDSIPNLKHWRKATKEELIEFFTKTPEKEGIKSEENSKITTLMVDIVTLSKRAIELIDDEIKSEENKTIEELFFADPIKFMDGLAYCRHQLVSHIENEPKKIGVDREKILNRDKNFAEISLRIEGVLTRFIAESEYQRVIDDYESKLKEVQSSMYKIMEAVAKKEKEEKIERDLSFAESGYLGNSVHKKIVFELEARACNCEKELAETESERFKLSLKVEELEEKIGKQNVAIVNHLARVSKIKEI